MLHQENANLHLSVKASVKYACLSALVYFIVNDSRNFQPL